MTNGRTHYDPGAIGVTTSTITFSRLLGLSQVPGRFGTMVQSSEQARAATNDLRRAQAGGEVRCFLPCVFVRRVCLRPAVCARATRRPTLDAAAINYFIATWACAENDGFNVLGCGRLIAGIGFLRLPASRTSV